MMKKVLCALLATLLWISLSTTAFASSTVRRLSVSGPTTVLPGEDMEFTVSVSDPGEYLIAYNRLDVSFGTFDDTFTWSDAATPCSVTITAPTAEGTYYANFTINLYNKGQFSVLSASKKITVDRCAKGHNYVKTEDVNATCTKEGSLKYTCTVCGGTDKENSKTYPKLSHKYGIWTPSDEIEYHTAHCIRTQCDCIGKAACELREVVLDDMTVAVCPICGYIKADAETAETPKLTAERIEKGTFEAQNQAVKNSSDLVVFAFRDAEGKIRFITTEMEIAGKRTGINGKVRITLPMESAVEICYVGKDEKTQADIMIEANESFEQKKLTFTTETMGVFFVTPVQAE